MVIALHGLFKKAFPDLGRNDNLYAYCIYIDDFSYDSLKISLLLNYHYVSYLFMAIKISNTYDYFKYLISLVSL